MKEILINCDNQLNKTICVLENQNVIEKYVEQPDSNRLEGNIYLGKVINVLEGMQAAFVDIGESQPAFLHIKDVLPKTNDITGNKNEEYSNYNIKDYIKGGMPILVQVKKDRADKKGARVSTNLNIAGRFVAILPNVNFITVSQKIEDINEIKRLREIIENVKIDGYGIVIRTSAVGKQSSEIIDDLENVIKLYEKIQDISNEILKLNSDIKPQVIYENGGIINKILVDFLDKDVNKIIVNNRKIYEGIDDVLKQANSEILLELVNKEYILDMYQADKQIEKANNRKVWLKSGGFIAIDKTEALTAIDVNTGKYTGKENLEDTVFKVNEEATIEIAKQLRLRDIGGIIVIDYIDMENKANEEKILNLLKDCLRSDRAKTQVIGFTPLHLVEMTRKHIFSA